MCEEARTARQWIAKSANDLLSADNDLKADRTPFDVVCFHCQQAAEKLLKAFLAAKGQTPPRTHDLLYLRGLVSEISTEAAGLQESLAILAPYAVEARYPDDAPDLSEQDAREAREAVEHVRRWLMTELPALFCPTDMSCCE